MLQTVYSEAATPLYVRNEKMGKNGIRMVLKYYKQTSNHIDSMYAPQMNYAWIWCQIQQAG